MSAVPFRHHGNDLVIFRLFEKTKGRKRHMVTEVPAAVFPRIHDAPGGRG